MVRFLEKYNIPKLTQYKTENLYFSKSIKGSVPVKKISTKEIPG